MHLPMLGNLPYIRRLSPTLFSAYEHTIIVTLTGCTLSLFYSVSYKTVTFLLSVYALMYAPHKSYLLLMFTFEILGCNGHERL